MTRFRLTVWNPVFQTMVNPLCVLLVLRLELGFTSLSISPREDIRHQLIVFTELRKSLQGVYHGTRCDIRTLTA